MTKGYDIRPWQPGDEHAILDLFHASFGRRLTPEFWRWRFSDHPAGGPLIMLAWKGDRLAAHYGASQAPLYYEEEVIPSAMSMTTMTHPDDRGLGLVETVGQALYDSLRGDGYAAVWGFPNAMINATRQRKLAWHPIDDIASLSMAVNTTRIPKIDPALKVETVDVIDARFWEAKKRGAQAGTVMGLRDAATLGWRVDRNPINTYTRYVIPAGAGQIAGYAITKSFGDAAVDIVDICGTEGGHVMALLAEIRQRAARDGIKQMNSWSQRMDPARLHLEHFGFAASAPVTYLGGRSFVNTINDFTDSRRWRIAMLDSDLY
ncbi:GNAT family N-acetyltransferase [Thalassobius sp. I31.1]|uniref:GNAT family N-acetyltransferase n=1 Tax=Thalassobius sp. I31.1 TaxID=2109912 RepID=UPI000D1B95C3|nr:GNAT family N-acetyltransferase [Thalassobius sp. I31.1]